MEKNFKLGDIIISGPNEYQIVSIYLDKRACDGYSSMVGLYSDKYKEVIAAMPGNSITEYLNNLLIDWKRK